jgi:hypothetical protein
LKRRAFLILGLLAVSIVSVGGVAAVVQSRRDLCFWDRTFPFLHEPENISVPIGSAGWVDLEFYIDYSEIIVTGRVLARYPSRWSTNTGAPPIWPLQAFDDVDTINTEWDFQPDRVLKGTVQDRTLRLMTNGGQVCRDSLFRLGAPALEVGKDYLLFLNYMHGTLEYRGFRVYHLDGPRWYMFVISNGTAVTDWPPGGGGKVWKLQDLIEYIGARVGP